MLLLNDADASRRTDKTPTNGTRVAVTVATSICHLLCTRHKHTHSLESHALKMYVWRAKIVAYFCGWHTKTHTHTHIYIEARIHTTVGGER